MLRRLALVWARRRAAETLLREGVVTRGGEASGEAARAETKGHVFDRKAFVAARRAALRGAAEEGAGEDVVPEALVEKQGSAASAVSVRERVFGMDSWRAGQEETVQAALDGQHVIAVLATGGGKSLCYQLPAVVTGRVTLVVSPLLALIQDQMAAARRHGLRAMSLASDVTPAARRGVQGHLQALASGEHDDGRPLIVFVTPERMAMDTFRVTLRELVARGHLARLVIDEAHCISEWGFGFRPEYRQLGDFGELVAAAGGRVPVMCLTATASPRVVDDMMGVLGLAREDVHLVRTSANRANIALAVRAKTADVLDDIGALVTGRHAGHSGIVYCLTRADAERVAAHLVDEYGVEAAHYHGDMGARARASVAARWKRSELHVVCTTVAFGMGIDKADARFVIHHSIPMSMEALHQHIGRAGRDGQQAHAYVFYGRGDRARVKAVQGQRGDESSSSMPPKAALGAGSMQGRDEALDDVVSYCEDATTCRRVTLLGHLGEEIDAAVCAGTCDVCDGSVAARPAARKKRAAAARRPLPFEQPRASAPTSSRPRPPTRMPAQGDLSAFQSVFDALMANPKVKGVLSRQAIRQVAREQPRTTDELAAVRGVGAKARFVADDVRRALDEAE